MSIGVRFQGDKEGLYSSFDKPKCDLNRQPSRDHVNEPFLYAEVIITNSNFFWPSYINNKFAFDRHIS